jgi:hypothetical protein
MFYHYLYSDHINIRSDINEYYRIINKSVAPKARRSNQAVLAAGSGGYTRITCRTLQTLRQGWMQVHAWQGPWSQVLPYLVLGQRQTGLHLCSPGGSRQGLRVCPQLSPCARSAQRIVRYQPRAATPQGAVLETIYGSVLLMDRLVTHCHANRKHGRTGRCDPVRRRLYQKGW